MMLNTKKTKVMNFNYTNNFQFSSRLTMDNEVVETISETKLLDVLINDSLPWDSNTAYIVKRANSRMRLLRKLVEFSVPVKDLLTIYILYIRSVLEQSCQVWHSSLSLENLMDIERVQKNSLKIILKEEYSSYEEALEKVDLESLVDRRNHLCQKFAKACLNNKNLESMFLLNDIEIRDRELYQVTFARTERLKKSAIPFMQRLLNDNK